MAKKKKFPKESILIDSGNSLSYEVEMMREIAFYVKKFGFRLPNSDLINTENFVLVAFLTHIRNLYYFFYEGGNSDWMSARHYLPKWREKIILPKDIKEYNIRIQHYLSHLSYRRADPDFKYKWKPLEVGLLYLHFRDLIIRFSKEVDEKYLTKRLKVLLRDIEKEINP